MSAFRNAFLPFHGPPRQPTNTRRSRSQHPRHVRGAAPVHGGSSATCAQSARAAHSRIGRTSSQPNINVTGLQARAGTSKLAASSHTRSRSQAVAQPLSTAAGSPVASIKSAARALHAPADNAVASRAGVPQRNAVSTASDVSSDASHSITDSSTAPGRRPQTVANARSQHACTLSFDSASLSDPAAAPAPGPAMLDTAGTMTMSAVQYAAFALPSLLQQLRAIEDAHAARRDCEAAIEQHAADRQQHQSGLLRLHALNRSIAEVRARNDDMSRRLKQARRKLASQRQQLQARRAQLDGPPGPGGALAAAVAECKQQRHAFPHAMHRWRDAHGRLVARRHQLVISAAHHFVLEPKVRTFDFNLVSNQFESPHGALRLLHACVAILMHVADVAAKHIFVSMHDVVDTVILPLPCSA